MYSIDSAGFSAAGGPTLRVSTALYPNTEAGVVSAMMANAGVSNLILGMGGEVLGEEQRVVDANTYFSNLVRLPALPAEVAEWAVASAPFVDRREMLLWEMGVAAALSQLPGFVQLGGWHEEITEEGAFRKVGTIRYQPGKEAEYARLEEKVVTEPEVAEPAPVTATMSRAVKVGLIGGLALATVTVVGSGITLLVLALKKG